MKKALIVVALALTLGGCAGSGVEKFVSAVTTTIKNPVGTVDLYRAKNVYASALEIAVKYRDYCWSKPYAALMADPIARPICQRRRPIVRSLQAADTKAYAAIRSAENFVRNNPTINATSAIGAAWAAVTDFQSLAASTAVAR